MSYDVNITTKQLAAAAANNQLRWFHRRARCLRIYNINVTLWVIPSIQRLQKAGETNYTVYALCPH